MKYAAIVVALLFCLSLAAMAQNAGAVAANTPLHKGARVAPLTLDEMLRAALLNNPQVRAAVRRVSLAQSKISAAGALDDPMAMYRDWGTPLKRPWDLNQAQHMFMLQQTFPSPGKRAARSAIAGKEVDLAKLELEATRRNLAVEVRKAFLDLLRNHDERRIHDEQMALVRQAFDSARVKYTVGKAPQQDVLKAQIAMTKLAEHLIMLEQDADMARATLNALMGRDPAAPLEVIGHYATPSRLPALADLQKLALESRPELVALQKQADIEDDKIGLARMAYKPDFTIAGGYMLMPEGSMSRNNYMAEVTINLPWLNQRKHDAEIAEARATASVTRAEFETRRAAVFLEIQEALVKARAAQRSLELYQQTLRPQTEATVKAAAAAYQHDRADFLSLIDSQNMLLDVETAYYRAAAGLDARLAELERAVGAPLPGEDLAQLQEEK